MGWPSSHLRARRVRGADQGIECVFAYEVDRVPQRVRSQASAPALDERPVARIPTARALRRAGLSVDRLPGDING